MTKLTLKRLYPDLKVLKGLLSFISRWGDRNLKIATGPEDITNVVLDQCVLTNLSNNQSQKIEFNQSAMSSVFIPSEDLAKTLGQLLSNGQEAQSYPKFIRLLLSSDEFISTELALPGIAAKDLKSAAELQGQSIFPGIQSAVLSFISPEPLPGKPDTYLVIWITQRRIESLFDALKIEGIFLWEVIPSAAIVASTLPKKIFKDCGATTTTYVTSLNSFPIHWLQVHSSDFENKDLRQHWGKELNENFSTEFVKPFRISELDINRSSVLFKPSEALALEDTRRRNGQIKRASFAVAITILFCAVPFFIQSVQFRLLADELVDVRSLSNTARQNRDFVVSQREEWAAINEYPDQNIPDIMFSLQELLYPDKLKNLEITEGVIEIEGESSNPQLILQRLEQHPLFTEAAFSRATNNNRYFIDFRLSTVNFDGYMVRYFLEN